MAIAATRSDSPSSQSVSDEFSDLQVAKDQLHSNLKPDIQTISGFTDYNVSEHYEFGRMLEATDRAFKNYGFTHFYPRPLEKAQNLLLKGGISKQIFGVSRLSDCSLTSLGIPFDRTLPFALFIAKNNREINYPYRRSDISYSFRGEHASAGRFRAFFQADVDVVGPNLGLINDFECLGAIIQALKDMKIGDFTLCINHIVIAKAMIAKAGVPKEKEPEVLRVIDKLDKLPAEEVANQVCALVPDIEPEKIKQMVQQFTFRSSPADFELEEGYDEEVYNSLASLKDLNQMLLDIGIDPKRIILSPGMVRGLDYYTGIVFETFVNGLERYGSIASGGRYSNLVDVFSKKATNVEGVGGSIGLTRLFDVLNREGRIAKNRTTSAQILVCYRTDELMKKAVKVASVFRDQGVSAALYSGQSKNIAKQLNYANKNGIPVAVMVMGDSSFVVKNLTKSEEQADKQNEVESIQKVWDAYQTIA